MTSRMQSCVDHIKTSLDVDPWAMELVEQVFEEYDRRFDKVLEFIDSVKQEFIEDSIEGEAVSVIHAIDRIKELRSDVLGLKGGE